MAGAPFGWTTQNPAPGSSPTAVFGIVALWATSLRSRRMPDRAPTGFEAVGRRHVSCGISGALHATKRLAPGPSLPAATDADKARGQKNQLPLQQRGFEFEPSFAIQRKLFLRAADLQHLLRGVRLHDLTQV